MLHCLLTQTDDQLINQQMEVTFRCSRVVKTTCWKKEMSWRMRVISARQGLLIHHLFPHYKHLWLNFGTQEAEDNCGTEALWWKMSCWCQGSKVRIGPLLRGHREVTLVTAEVCTSFTLLFLSSALIERLQYKYKETNGNQNTGENLPWPQLQSSSRSSNNSSGSSFGAKSFQSRRLMLEWLPHLLQWDKAVKCSLLSVMLTRRETFHRRSLLFSLFFFLLLSSAASLSSHAWLSWGFSSRTCLRSYTQKR